MTQTQRTRLTEGLWRALNDGCAIKAQGKVNQQRAWWVSSGTRKGVEYLVTQEGGHLVCSCPAGESLCKHRALVWDFLCVERQVASVA